MLFTRPANVPSYCQQSQLLLPLLLQTTLPTGFVPHWNCRQVFCVPPLAKQASIDWFTLYVPTAVQS